MLEPLLNQAMIFEDDKIIIHGTYLITKEYSVNKKDFIIDQLAQYYKGQKIVVLLGDGENSKESGFETFLKWCCKVLNIPTKQVTFETQNLDLDPAFDLKPIGLSVFRSALDHVAKFEKDLSQAKFIGYTFGRFTIPRLRVAYELDKLFAYDSYCEFSQSPTDIDYSFQNFKDNYADEIAWFKSKQFNTHLATDYSQTRANNIWINSYAQYHAVWNQYHIEIVPETDALSSYYFTEKTARCLATGKPFVLISGPNSLHRLREMGFQTFGAVLDETYDSAEYVYQRIQLAIKSLQELYTSPDKDTKLQQLYNIASQNIQTYQTLNWQNNLPINLTKDK